MSSLHYAARYRCDFCGVLADVPPPEGKPLEDDGPPGWLTAFSGRATKRRLGLRIWAETPEGSRFGDMCADCQQLPVAELLVLLERQLGERTG